MSKKVDIIKNILYFDAANIINVAKDYCYSQNDVLAIKMKIVY